MVNVRPATPGDVDAWLRMRLDLWRDESGAEHREEIKRYFAGRAIEPLEVLLAEAGEWGIAGFAELSLRPYAEGCSTSPVAYLEGWYVAPQARRSGVGRALVQAAEEWARSKGCREFASDAAVDDEDSARAHAALGFDEVGVVRCFRKGLVAIYGMGTDSDLASD